MLLAALAILRGGGWQPLAGLALAFAAALLTRSSAILYLFPLPALLLARPQAGGAPGLRRPATRIVLALLTGYLIYYLAFGGTSYAEDVADYNSIYAMSISDLLFLPLGQWLANAAFLVENALDLLGVLPALLGACSLVWAWRRGQAAQALALWILVPVGLHLLVGTGLFARYFAPVLPWLALLSAAALAAGTAVVCSRWRLPAGQCRSPRSAFDVPGGQASVPAPAARAGTPAPPQSLLELAATTIDGQAPRFWVAGLVAGLVLLLVQPAYGALRLQADARWTIERGYTHDLGAVLEELRQELRGQAAQGPVVLLIYRGQGPLEDGSWVFLEREPGVRLLYLAPRFGGMFISGPGVPPSAELVPYDASTGKGVPARELRGERVYFVGGDGRNPPPGTVGHVEPVATFTGLAGTHPLTLFRPTWDEAYWDGEGLVLR